MTYRWLIALLTTWLGVASVLGQGTQTSFESAGGAAGLSFLKPQSWGMIRSRVVNRGDVPADVLSVVQFKKGDNIQFVTKAWLPAHSVREVLQPVFVFPELRDERAAEIMSLLIDTTQGEQLRGKEEGLIRIDDDKQSTAVVTDADADHAISAVVAARIALGESKRLAYVAAGQLPAITAAYESLTTLVLASRELTLTPEQVMAIRQWVAAGGRLWLMVDRLPADVGLALLGDSWPATEVDRVNMTDVTIEGPGGPLQRTRDEPWLMTRMIINGTEVLHRVNGWPASFRFDVGQGRVLVTTLDASMWWTDPPKAGEESVATPPLTELAEILGPGSQTPVTLDKFEGFVRDQIGYRILSRGPVLGVLAVLPLALLLSGLWLARKGRLELVGIVAAVAAVGLCGVLIGMGAAQRRTVPLTVASAQWVEVAPEQNLASVQAAISIYSPTADRGPLRGQQGGVLWPDMTGQAGRQLRMVWTDMDHWSWEGLELPSGAVRTAESSHVLRMSEPVRVTLGFGKGGLEGQLQRGPFEQMQDLVLATPTATMSVRPDSDGRFTIGEDDALPRGEYIRGVALSQTQRQRQQMYRNLLGKSNYPLRPTLLGWAKSLDLGLELSIPAVQQHAALVAMPVTLTPATAGQTVSVPAAFLPFTLVRGPNNAGTTTLYSAATREWIGNITQGATLLFRFKLPPQVLPLEPQGATLQMDLVAPDRQAEIVKVAGSQLVSVHTIDGPTGTLRLRLDADDLGDIDSGGGIIIGVRIGESADMMATSTWRIDNVGVSIDGVVKP